MINELKQIRAALYNASVHIGYLAGNEALGKEQANKALELIDTLIANSGWRTIESAPKDGTYILLTPTVSLPNGVGSCSIMRWVGGVYPWELGGSCGCNDNPIYPTHWMPLPPPPANKEHGE